MGPDKCIYNPVPDFLRAKAAAIEDRPMTATEVLQRQSPPVGNASVPAKPAAPSILLEAHLLTHGPRQSDYGHPLDDFTCTAAIASALLSNKLTEPITASEMALIMVGVKLSRQSRQAKRDNTVDGAGYFWVAQECLDEKARRDAKVSTTETK
jgi:Domain of unknown function (DUF6378)